MTILRKCVCPECRRVEGYVNAIKRSIHPVSVFAIPVVRVVVVTSSICASVSGGDGQYVLCDGVGEHGCINRSFNGWSKEAIAERIRGRGNAIIIVEARVQVTGARQPA